MTDATGIAVLAVYGVTVGVGMVAVAMVMVACAMLAPMLRRKRLGRHDRNQRG